MHISGTFISQEYDGFSDVNEPTRCCIQFADAWIENGKLYVSGVNGKEWLYPCRDPKAVLAQIETALSAGERVILLDNRQ